MDEKDRIRESLRVHKRWADGPGLIGTTITIGVFIGAHILMEQTATEPLERVSLYILLSTVVIVICVWQAADLRSPGSSDPAPPDGPAVRPDGPWLA